MNPNREDIPESLYRSVRLAKHLSELAGQSSLIVVVGLSPSEAASVGRRMAHECPDHPEGVLVGIDRRLCVQIVINGIQPGARIIDDIRQALSEFPASNVILCDCAGHRFRWSLQPLQRAVGRTRVVEIGERVAVV